MGIIEPLAMGTVVLDAGIYFGSAALLWGVFAVMLSTLTGVLLARDLNLPRSA